MHTIFGNALYKTLRAYETHFCAVAHYLAVMTVSNNIDQCAFDGGYSWKKRRITSKWYWSEIFNTLQAVQLLFEPFCRRTSLKYPKRGQNAWPRRKRYFSDKLNFSPLQNNKWWALAPLLNIKLMTTKCTNQTTSWSMIDDLGAKSTFVLRVWTRFNYLWKSIKWWVQIQISIFRNRSIRSIEHNSCIHT